MRNLVRHLLYNGEEMVGILFSFEADEDYQKLRGVNRAVYDRRKIPNQGLGTQAFLAGLDWFKTISKRKNWSLRCDGNEIATKLYERNGFVLTGEMIENEHVLLLQLPTDQG